MFCFYGVEFFNEEVEPAEWERTMVVNINRHFLCTRKAVPLLK